MKDRKIKSVIIVGNESSALSILKYLRTPEFATKLPNGTITVKNTKDK